MARVRMSQSEPQPHQLHSKVKEKAAPRERPHSSFLPEIVQAEEEDFHNVQKELIADRAKERHKTEKNTIR